MEKLFTPINVKNFSLFQEELIKSLPLNFKDNGLHAFNRDEETMSAMCPNLMSWLKSRSKMPFRLLRYYVTPPRTNLGAHIDGYKAVSVPLGLNFPVIGYHNTYQIYYDCAVDNLADKNKGDYLDGVVPKDSTTLKEIARFEINKPGFVRNDVMHSVENATDHWRVVFIVRWILHPFIGRTIEEVFNIEDLYER
jgi:hypothetical protein